MHDSTASANTLASTGTAPSEVAQEVIATVPLAANHAVGDFDCGRSERINSFIRSEFKRWVELNYCRIFILPSPDDPNAIWGYYTLSAALLIRNEISGQHQKKAIPGIPVPLVRIGYMGRHVNSPKDTGAALIADAALRVHKNSDVAAWGLVLDAENQNENLMKRYEDIGFKRAKTLGGVMYGPLKSFLG